MKLTLSWLFDHLETTAPLEHIIHTLTTIGHEVEEVEENRWKNLAPILVGEVSEVRRHPNADRLALCSVRTAKAPSIQVVCGAPNVRDGMKAAFAPPGTKIGHITLECRHIRGELSEGMLLSAEELGVGKSTDEILDLHPSCPVGASLYDVLAADDPVLNIAITPNRPDCLGVRGLARDLHAAGLGLLKPLPQTSLPREKSSFHLRQTQDSPWLLGGSGLEIALEHIPSSPLHMVRRLLAIGHQSHGFWVDLSNYIMWDTGRPSHMYDRNNLQGDVLTFRTARKTQSFRDLHGKNLTLPVGTPLTMDSAGVTDIPGLIGGERTAVGPKTFHIVCKFVLLDPPTIRKLGQNFGSTDAAYRFERGVDISSPHWAPHLLASYIPKDTHPYLAPLALEPPTQDTPARVLLFDMGMLQRMGSKMSTTRARKLLCALGYKVSEGPSPVTCTPPPFRVDIEHPEEVAADLLRIDGLQNIAPAPLPPVGPRPNKDLGRTLLRQLTLRGYHEVIARSFEEDDNTPRKAGLVVANPIHRGQAVLRHSALRGLIAMAKENQDMGYEEGRLVELGPLYGEEKEETALTALHFGAGRERRWRKRRDGLYDIKADLDHLFASRQLQPTTFKASSAWHPGRSTAYRVDDTIVAEVGELHPDVYPDLVGSAFALALYVDRLPLELPFTPSPRWPKHQRLQKDLSFTLPAEHANEVRGWDIVQTAEKALKKSPSTLDPDVLLFDVYQSEQFASWGITLRWNPVDNITDTTIQTIIRTVSDAVESLHPSLRLRDR